MKKIGEIIGNYIIKDYLGETPNACLYRAIRYEVNGENEELPYVLKEYKNNMVECKEKRITQHIEAESSDSIVVPILHSECDNNGKNFLVMQSREKGGCFLNDLIHILEKKYSKTSIPISLQLDIIEKILISVESLHKSLKEDEMYEGYLHLDLHPGNIYIESVDIEQSPEKIGAVKFIDFYNALPIKRFNKRAKCSETDAIGITAGFSAPELDDIGTKEYTISTDLYSVSAIAARIYTGKDINDAFDTYESIVRNSDNVYTDNPVVDIIIKKFILCGLEYNALYRYSSAKDMLMLLNKIKECEKNKTAYYDLFDCSYELHIMAETIDLSRFNFNTKGFENSIRKLDKVLHSNHFNRRKCVYIFELLWNLFLQEKISLSQECKYMLISSGIASNNHLANTDRVIQLCEELEKYKAQMPIMDYLDIMNRCAVAYVDLYRTEEAYNIIRKNVVSLEKIKSCYGEVARDNDMDVETSSRIILLGRAYSALGCYGTMLHKKDEPLQMFERALKEFEISPDNQKITIAHILHYAVEEQDRELFERYGEKYFERELESIGDIKAVFDKDVKILFDNIETDIGKCISLLFEIFILLKGTYYFYIKELNDSFIKEIEKFVNSSINIIAEHPLQFVYKYMGLIMYNYYNSNCELESHMNDIDLAFQKSVCCVKEAVIDSEKPLNILMVSSYQTMAIYNRLTGQDDENKLLINWLKQHAEKSRWKNLENELDKINSNEIKCVDNILCFEYS